MSNTPVTDPTAPDLEKWEKIPAPSGVSTTVDEWRMYRAALAKKALSYAYDEDPSCVLTDAIADLLTLAELTGADPDAVLRVASGHYRSERYVAN